LLGLHGRFG